MTDSPLKVLNTQTLYVAKAGKRPILSLHERQYERDGRKGSYFLVCRGDNPVPNELKRPDAVSIVAFYNQPGEPTKLVLINEYRIAIGGREISFPAGLIDDQDYDPNIEGRTASCRAAACRAAIREMKEETGLDFVPTEVSPVNLYSSAGMTNESVCYVIGTASGTPSTDGNEAMEDIRVNLLTLPDVIELLDTEQQDAISKTCWPFLWSFKYNGFPVALQSPSP